VLHWSSQSHPACANVPRLLVAPPAATAPSTSFYPTPTPAAVCGPCRYDLADFAALKSQFQIASDKGMSQAMFDMDLKVQPSPPVLLRAARCCFKAARLLPVQPACVARLLPSAASFLPELARAASSCQPACLLPCAAMPCHAQCMHHSDSRVLCARPSPAVLPSVGYACLLRQG